MTGGAWIRSDIHAPQHTRVIGYYLTSVSFTCVLWSARMSILFSIMRIIPNLMTLRRYASACAALFIAMWIVMLVQKTYVCEHNTAWKTKPGVQCVLGKAVGAVELATDITADIILVALPIRLLWDISISSSRRKLLITIFSASLITTIVSIVHAGFELSPDRDGEGITAHIEASTSLIICNLAVLVTWLVRVIRHGEDLESAPGFTDSSTKRRNTAGQTQLTSLRFGTQPPIVLNTMNSDIDELDSDQTKSGELSVTKSGELSKMSISPTNADARSSEPVKARAL
ncbi:hypothetical protein AcW1_001753 [Taiwanofungus camphoratus]|nr:hypothetical protein AcV5_000196 [Antrodia cinnamomea]KAI0944937.1 hypothetical protein AcV7_001605 [Antrodia cinnamomea]KAI0945557.1 hypothetical protein AcW1_001753 [Antrodia cinnamomea]